MKWLDKLTVNSSRRLAQNSSRRSFITRFGTALVGGAAIPLLPVARASASSSGGGMYPGVAAQESGVKGDPGDPSQCDYWRYCAIDGFLCSCCGGTQNSCPPGTEMSPITWIGTCLNPEDGKSYIISYNDCCGTSSCGRCLCNRNERDTPIYRAQTNNDTNWCLGASSTVYTCSTAIVLGVATDSAS
ncbi:methylamine dehydrogenase light chain [uncultured Pseudoteredinibacter sp.]|uniref:methylamine dehydrogenase light chain n=1 Tax=uncultured Pseudoteredinibacter sp. TaxID=1641701 RepID=UPI002622CC2B|nr:methylamine dehydrogenase light chain [uncultured Pseudoteredinibacter sp.]